MNQPRTEFNTDGRFFSILSWSMGILCIPTASFYLWIYSSPNGTAMDLLLAVVWLVGANFIIPPIRKHWMRVMGIDIRGKRLIYTFFAFFTTVMGLSYMNDIVRGQGLVDEQKTYIATTKIPLDSIMAPAKNGPYWGYVNTQGVLRIEPQYEEAGPFKQGVAKVLTVDGETKYINYKNELTNVKQVSQADTVYSRWQPKEDNGRWGYADSTGKWLFQARYDGLGPWGYTYLRKEPTDSTKTSSSTP